MKGNPAAGRKTRLVSVLALAAGLGLAGCSDLDNSMFGPGDDSGSVPSTAPDQGAPPAGAPGGGNQPGTLPGAFPAAGGGSGPGGGSAPIVAITPVSIEPGSNTGTAVSAHHRHAAQPGADAGGSSRGRRLALERPAQPGRRRGRRLSRIPGAHHDAAPDRHDARQSRARDRVEQRAVRARQPGRQHQCAEFPRRPRSPRIPRRRISRSTRSRRPTTSPARSTRITASSACSRTRPTRPSC